MRAKRADLAQVAAHQREVMMTVRLADAPHALERVLVADMAAERVAGVGRIGDDPAGAHDLGGAADQPRLRVDRMQFEVLATDLRLAAKMQLAVEVARGA